MMEKTCSLWTRGNKKLEKIMETKIYFRRPYSLRPPIISNRRHTILLPPPSQKRGNTKVATLHKPFERVPQKNTETVKGVREWVGCASNLVLKWLTLAIVGGVDNIVKGEGFVEPAGSTENHHQLGAIDTTSSVP
ncbi:hypothetical protein AAZV13_16G053600 [Glycine max]